jgi:hypothetical protein
MEQLNIKTKEAKTMGIFTTNWYLYKTCLHPISKKPQTQNSVTVTEIYELKKRRVRSKNREAEKRTMNFEEDLLEAIDEGFSLLGESPKQAVYFHLEKTFQMNRLDIPYRIEEFTDAIEKIFGTGAKILEIQIMRCLFKKVGYTFKHYPKRKNITFTEYIAAVKLEKNKSENRKKQQQKLNRKQNRKKDNARTNTLERSLKQSNWIYKSFSGIALL